MYQKPRLDRFGTFRELTLWGMVAPDCDGGGIWGMGGSYRCAVAPQTNPESGGGS